MQVFVLPLNNHLGLYKENSHILSVLCQMKEYLTRRAENQG